MFYKRTDTFCTECLTMFKNDTQEICENCGAERKISRKIEGNLKSKKTIDEYQEKILNKYKENPRLRLAKKILKLKEVKPSKSIEERINKLINQAIELKITRDEIMKFSRKNNISEYMTGRMLLRFDELSKK